MSPDILVCPYCGKKSNWVDYHGDQYKKICPFCQRNLNGSGNNKDAQREKDGNNSG